MAELSHVSEVGDVQMVDVGGKPMSRRRAVARATVSMAPETAGRLRELPKGDALVTAQLAGIMAAKRTSELIPLCHPLQLSHIGVSLEVGEAGVEIRGVVETTAQQDGFAATDPIIEPHPDNPDVVVTMKGLVGAVPGPMDGITAEQLTALGLDPGPFQRVGFLAPAGPAEPVPEPSTLALAGAAFIAFAVRSVRRRWRGPRS